jgi:thymidylate synthase
MVVIIKGQNVNEVFVKVSKALLSEGHRNDPRGLLTMELCDAWLIIEDVSNPVVSLPERDINIRYLMGEMEWYNSGSLLAKDIHKYSKFWTTLADSNGTINSNYGFLALIEKWSGKSQVEWCINSLKKDKHTRQAVINYNQPRHKYEGVKDFVCTLTQQFVVRNGKLDMVVLMRSNDLIFGLTYDIPWFVSVLRTVSEATGIPMGTYNHYASSLHVYEKHFKMVEAMANAHTSIE